MLNRKF